MKTATLPNSAIILVISVAMALMLFLALLSPSGQETTRMLLLTAVGAAASLLAVEAWTRWTGTLTNLKLRPRLLAAFSAVLLVAFGNVIALSLFMFVSADHDLPLLLATVGFAGVLSLLIAYRIAGDILAPVRELADAAGLVTAGDLSARVAVRSTDEFGELATVFNRMAGTLEQHAGDREEMESERRELTAAVSHDLRTPLSSMQAMLEALSDGVVSEEEARADYIQRVLGEVRHMTALVDEFFELSLLDSGSVKLTVERFDAGALVDEVVSAMSALAADRNVEMRCVLPEPAVTLEADRTKLRRALSNLVQNAVQYSPAGGTVEVRLKKVAGGAVIISVLDEGPGVPPDQAERVWGRFYRGDRSRTRAAETTAHAGLGLPTARAIVEMHGGEITLSNRPEGGAEFRITLPA